MIQILWVLLISTITLFNHELGHYASARAMHLTIKKVGFSMKPVPRAYVAVVDKGITLPKRFAYLASGNAMTIITLAAVLLSGMDLYLLTRVLAFQLLVETNPFMSDYSTLFFYLKNQKLIDSIPVVIRSDVQKKKIDEMVSQMRENYFMSGTWFVHFLLWTILVITLLKNLSL